MWPIELAKHFQQVISFEPENENYKCARKNLDDRGVDNVTLYNLALGETNCVKYIERALDTDGSHQIVDKPSDRTQEIALCTIDSLDVEPDLIMLDIEGFEYYALRGGLKTISRCLPTIVIEFNRAAGTYGISRDMVLGLLTPLSYFQVDKQYKDIILRVR